MTAATTNEQDSITIFNLADHLENVHPADIRAGVNILSRLNKDNDEIEAGGRGPEILELLAEPDSFMAALQLYAEDLYSIFDELFGLREKTGSHCKKGSELTNAMDQLERIGYALGVEMYHEEKKGVALVSKASLDPIERWMSNAPVDHIIQSVFHAQAHSEKAA
ncbi:MAG: hypothetical protein LAP21_26115 [Acidobacteriia bacterium]|nr:hypothetical protein [Terriglobia bacterium]